jgi:hypothetical protein
VRATEGQQDAREDYLWTMHCTSFGCLAGTKEVSLPHHDMCLDHAWTDQGGGSYQPWGLEYPLCSRIFLLDYGPICFSYQPSE